MKWKGSIMRLALRARTIGKDNRRCLDGGFVSVAASLLGLPPPCLRIDPSDPMTRSACSCVLPLIVQLGGGNGTSMSSRSSSRS